VTKVGVVDLGTNSTRLLVAEVEGGRVRELERRLTITRLGEGVGGRRLLLPTAIARVRNALTDYRRTLDASGVDRTFAVATSAVREAENGEAFLGEVEWSYGFDTRLLSGDEEALMTFAGVFAGREAAEGTLVVDVGGGSTELVLGGPDGVAWHISLALGCVRLTERFLASDPPTPGELEACRNHVRALLAEHVPEETRPSHAVGVAGTVTTLATLSLELDEENPALVHGHTMSTGWIGAEAERLAALPVAAIRESRGIHPDRAPVIVAGTVVVAETLRHFGLSELEVSEQDLMHGAALAAVALPERTEGNAPPGAYTCC
jgi:exopolyphosphatase / guanosine-5'-triphosphate,3'-diphosphate pyrophosphatase